MWAPPRAAASDVAASAVAATSRVLDRLGDAVVHVKAAFDAACAASQDAAGLPGALQVPGALLVSEPALRALLLLAGQHAYPARCHAEAQRRGLLPPEERAPRAGFLRGGSRRRCWPTQQASPSAGCPRVQRGARA